jgi:hypothetical protein
VDDAVAVDDEAHERELAPTRRVAHEFDHGSSLAARKAL